MSSGLRSAIRLTAFPWVVVNRPSGKAPVIVLTPGCVAASLMMRPSTTYSGELLPMMDVTPRRLMLAPPPGAGELLRIMAPGIFPCSDCSKLAFETLTRSSATSRATELAWLRRATPVARPVTTISSRRKASRSRAMMIVVCPAESVISLDR